MEKRTIPLQMECTMLFQSNPYMIETPEGISVRLGRKVEDILPIIDQLSIQGILQRLGDETSPLYRYQEPIIITNLDIQGEAEKA